MTTPQEPRNPSGSFQNGSGSLGRDVRLFMGAIAVLGDGVLLYMEHVHAVPPAAYSTPDIVMHVAILILGAFLMDPRRLLELVASVKDRIPIIGGK